MSTARAAVLIEPGKLETRDFPVPEIHDDDGLLRVEVTGVCGSDWGAYANGGALYDMPCILGHEVVGRVERVGKRAARRWGVTEGDRVAVEEYLPCGTCDACLVGYYQMCTTTRYGGKSIHDPPSLWGGFSEYMYLDPKALVHKVSEDVPLGVTQLFIPIANGIHWVQELGGARIGDTIVILGPGPHGLGAVVGAREAGAHRVIVIGLSSNTHRLTVARKLGAEHTVLADQENVAEKVAEITEGRMGDVVINATGSPEGLTSSIELAGTRATVVHAGVSEQPATVSGNMVVMKALTIKGVRGRPSRAVRPALRIIESGRYPLETLCTHTFGIEETEQALRMVGEGAEGFVRGLVTSA